MSEAHLSGLQASLMSLVVRVVLAFMLCHLLALEDMLVELLLQPFIGEVDAQLLKAVLLEAFEAIDVQDADAAMSLRPLTCTCNFHDENLSVWRLVHLKSLTYKQTWLIATLLDDALICRLFRYLAQSSARTL